MPTKLAYLDNIEERTFVVSKYIVRKSKPNLSTEAKIMARDRDKLHEIYSGSENPFVIDSVHHAKFTCVFDFSQYPFDHQECSFFILLVETSAKLKAGNVTYHGPNIMGQFKVDENKWSIKCNKEIEVRCKSFNGSLYILVG